MTEVNPYYEKNGVTLYCDDIDSVCRHRSFLANLIIADPPFNLKKVFDQNWERDEYYGWCDTWIAESFEHLSPGGSIFLMTIQEHVGEMMRLMGKWGTFKNLIIWHNSSMPVKNRFCIGYQPILWYVHDDNDYIFNYGSEQRHSKAAIPWGRKNKSHSLKDIWDDIPFVSAGCMASKEAILVPGTKKKVHSAQMPIRLAERMIKYCSNPGDTILDVFAGSGTTLVAARGLDRKSIGIEKNEEYCRLIIDRLEGRIIAEADIPKKNSRKDIFG